MPQNQNEKQMKRIIAFGLMIMLLIAVQSMVPQKTVPVDQDVGVYYVIQPDQSMVDMNYSAGISAPICLSAQDVEKSCDYLFIQTSFNMQYTGDTMNYLSTPASYDRAVTQSPNSFRGIGGLSPGEVFPRAGGMARHS